jgi:hypothetical protein
LSCEKESNPDIDNFDYFPLQVGNKWVYAYKTEEVLSVKNINGKEYFEIVGYHKEGEADYVPYYQYFRKTPDGKVFKTYNDSVNEYLIYDFSVPLNHTWTYKDNGDSEWTVTNVADYKNVLVHGFLLDSCRQFDYDIKQAVDDENTVILAPGLGRLISYSYAWGFGDTLKSAVIDGKLYNLK